MQIILRYSPKVAANVFNRFYSILPKRLFFLYRRSSLQQCLFGADCLRFTFYLLTYLLTANYVMLKVAMFFCRFQDKTSILANSVILLPVLDISPRYRPTELTPRTRPSAAFFLSCRLNNKR